MKKLIYLLIITNTLCFSCKDNDQDITIEVRIGERDRNINVNEMNPPIYVTDHNSDSIDLNGDLQYDLIFEKKPTPLATGFGMKTEMTKKIGVQIVLSSVNNYPDTLSYLAKLNNQENWSDDSDETLILQSYANNDEKIIIGNFITQKEKFLGVKIEHHYGWVKLTNDKFGALVIKEYAMTK